MTFFHGLTDVLRKTGTIIHQRWRELLLFLVILWAGSRGVMYFVSHNLDGLPLVMTSQGVGLSEAAETLMMSDPGAFMQMIVPHLGGIILVIVVITLFMILFQMLILKMSLDTLDATYTGLQDTFRRINKKIIPYIGTGILQSIYLLGLYLLLIIPGLIYSIYRLFSSYVVLATDTSYKGAMDLSKKMVKGRRWKTLGVLVIIMVGIMIISVVLEQVSLLFPLSDTGWSTVMIDLITKIINILVMVFMSAFFVSWYRSYIVSSSSERIPPTSDKDTV